MSTFHFPRWTNHFKLLIPAGAIGGVLYAVVFVWLGFSPKTIARGYEPTQPVPFSHALHAGELGFDCRYCHNTVEDASHAAIPPTETCMRCHSYIHPDKSTIAPLKQSWETGVAVDWVRVHDLADYAYFNHSAHVRRGVSCVECHGRVDQMEVVRQQEPLSMGWCLDCHRNPNDRIRPLSEITNLAWERPEGTDWQSELFYGMRPADAGDAHGHEHADAEAHDGHGDAHADLHQSSEAVPAPPSAAIQAAYSTINPQESCSTCHR